MVYVYTWDAYARRTYMDPRLPWGMVEMLILEVLSRGSNEWVSDRPDGVERIEGVVRLKEGRLYPALHRMERQHLLNSYWEETADGRHRNFYKPTPSGRRLLGEKRQEWVRFSAGVSGVSILTHIRRIPGGLLCTMGR